MEGRLEHLVYRCPARKSPLELGRNTENALKSAGFEVLYTDVYAGGARFYMTARKGAHWVHLNVLSDRFDLYVLQAKEMAQVMTADAEGGAAEEPARRSGEAVLRRGYCLFRAGAFVRPVDWPVAGSRGEVISLVGAERFFG